VPRNPKGFSRVDSESTNAHGWLVRIKRGDVRRSRFISDSTHGGKRKSKLVAQQVYEEWLKELPAPETSLNKLNRRNTTGVVGVHYSHDVDGRYPGCEYESYIASWLSDAGKRTKLGFSCNKYGNKAFALACLARELRTTDRQAVLDEYAARKGKVKKAPKKKAGTKKQAASGKSAARKMAGKKKSAKKKGTKKTASSRSAGRKKAAGKTARKR
jgi:hypothetical protein